MGGDKTNKTGHWESTPICRLDDRILHSAGTRWDDWLEVNPGWLQSPKAEEFREEALGLLREEFGSSRLFVLKDPRICRLVPFWLGVLEEAGAQPIVVFPLRNPLEVSASLKMRNGFEAGLGHLLWLRHVLDAEFASRGTPRFFTSYDRLIGGWARVATDAQSTLGIAWPRMSDEAAGDIERFLSDHHRHHLQPIEAVLDNPTLSDWLRSTFEILGRWVAAGDSPHDFAALDRIRVALNTAAPAFSRLLAAEQSKALRLEKERDTAEKTATAEQEKASRLEKELSSERQRIGETEQQITELRHRLEQTESALAQRRHEAEQTAGELAAAREQVRRTAAACAEAEKLSAGMKEHIVLLMAERESAVAALREARAAESAETKSAIVTVAGQVKQVLAVLDTSHHELATWLHRAEQARPGQTAELETRLKQQADEIETLRRLVEEKQDEAHHERAEAERLRQVAGSEIGRAAGLLNGHGLASLWRPFRLRRQVARLRRSGVFDAEWYLRHYTDVASAGIDPLRHYIEFGANEGRAPNAALAHSNGKAQAGTM